MNNFHRIWFQNFRQFSSLFSQIRSKKRHTSLFSGICREIRTKFHLKFAEKLQNSTQKWKKIGNSLFIRGKMLTIFGWNFEIWAVQKYVNLVDLVKSFPASIYLQKSASIQPRTSLSKFEVIYSLLFIRLLTTRRLGWAATAATPSSPCTSTPPSAPFDRLERVGMHSFARKTHSDTLIKTSLVGSECNVSFR